MPSRHERGSHAAAHWMRVAVVIVGTTLLLFSAGGCGDDDPHSCDNGAHACADPDKPYCDLEGRFPESMGVSGVCIPNPFGDAGVDAAP